jgi:hypothetical protein
MNHPVASAGQQGCDDHAHADEHINENDGGAAVDVHGGPNLEPLLFDDKRRLIPGGYRSSYRMVAIWQLDRLDDLGAANARAVAVEQVNGQQVREMSVIFTTDLHRFRSSVRSRAPSGPVGSSRHRSRAGSRLETSTSTCSSPMRIGRSGSRELSTPSWSFPR